MDIKLPIYQVDAFADSLFQGNPAAVCPLESWLPDELMQSIAAENNLSETAFFVRKGRAFEIRWFTPEGEVELCGHATLASAYVILNYKISDSGPVLFESASGELRVTRDKDYLQLDFPAIPYEPMPVPAELVASLGMRPEEVYSGMDIMAILPNEGMVSGLNPKFHMMRKLPNRAVIVTAPGDEVDFVSRFFAPGCGIDEDPVTGSAHCMMAPYWAARLRKSKLTARQLSERGGSLHCEVREGRVLISGKAVPYMEGTIQVRATDTGR